MDPFVSVSMIRIIVFSSQDRASPSMYTYRCGCRYSDIDIYIYIYTYVYIETTPP